jgi:uncharacterized membrane protein YdjX (TVP38/TMEM64 family)
MTALLKRYGLLALLLILLGAAWFSGLTRSLTLPALRDHQAQFQALVQANLPAAIALYALAYMAATAISLPGGSVLTMTGGLLFGAWLGGAAAITGATLGAVIIFYAARSAFGEGLRRRAEGRGGLLNRVMEGAKKDAFSYILTLRLMPVAPFWLVNLAAGLADAPLSAYLPATFLGIIPGTFVFSFIGAGLAKVFARGGRPDLSVVASPQVLAPLAALAVLAMAPIAIRTLKRARGA